MELWELGNSKFYFILSAVDPILSAGMILYEDENNQEDETMDDMIKELAFATFFGFTLAVNLVLLWEIF